MRPRKLAWKSRFQKSIERIEFTKFRNPTVNDITWFPWQIYLEISLLFHTLHVKKKTWFKLFKFLSILNILMNYLSWDKIKFVYIYKSKLEIQNSLVFSFFFSFSILSRINPSTQARTRVTRSCIFSFYFAKFHAEQNELIIERGWK